MQPTPGILLGQHSRQALLEKHGPILVYDFDGASSVAYTECNGGGRIAESADEVGDLSPVTQDPKPTASRSRCGTAS